MLQPRSTPFLLIYYLTKILETFASEKNQFYTSFNGLQNDYNFGHMGYVFLDSDGEIPELELSSCNAYDVNKTTCDFFRRSAPRSEGDVMVLRAWAATTLRDNILVFFGYLMYQRTSRAFAREIRPSVRLLYEEIRRNGFHTMDIVPRLGALAKTNQMGQVIWLLKSLDAVGPAYCRSAIDELGKYFSKRKELLRSILSTQGGINLLSDIGVQMIPNLRLNDEVNRPFDQEVADMLGREFAIFFRAIQSGKIVLSQPVLAVFMLNMKFDGMTPIEMEKFRYFCDVLRLNKVPNWSPATIGPCCANYKDPYALVARMTSLMSRRTKADSMITKTVNELTPRLVRFPEPDDNALQMDDFFGNSNFNVSLFLDVLERQANIPEVKQFRTMVSTRSIDLSYGLKGFIRYFYDTPRLLTLALLERIRYRVPMNAGFTVLLDLILAYLRSMDKDD